MDSATRQKFSSHAAPELITALRNIAVSEGRQFEAVLDEALRAYVNGKQGAGGRAHVAAAFAQSVDEFESLYRELAK